MKAQSFQDEIYYTLNFGENLIISKNQIVSIYFVYINIQYNLHISAFFQCQRDFCEKKNCSK